MRLRLTMIVLLSGLAAAAPPALADTTLATVPRTTELATGFGVLLSSAYDAEAGTYRLMAREDGRTQALPVAPSSRPFQADVGPTRSGHAFFCAQGECISPRAEVTALELHGHSRLAQLVRSDDVQTFAPKGRPREIYRSEGVELRLLDRDLTRSRRLIRSGTGIGGQRLTGLAFTSRGLFVSFSCLGDPGGCTRLKAGIYRYVYDGDPSDSNWQFAADPSPIYALAVVNSRVYEVRDGREPVEGANAGLECDQESFGAPEAPRCAIVQRDRAPEFVSLPAP